MPGVRLAGSGCHPSLEGGNSEDLLAVLKIAELSCSKSLNAPRLVYAVREVFERMIFPEAHDSLKDPGSPHRRLGEGYEVDHESVSSSSKIVASHVLEGLQSSTMLQFTHLK